MTHTTPPTFETLDQLNQSIYKTLLSHGVLYTPRHQQCSKITHVPLKRSPTDKFRRSLRCEDLSCPNCRSIRVNQSLHEVRDYIRGFHDQGGRTLLLTLTLNHRRNTTCEFLSKKIRDTLSHFKNSHQWRQLKRQLNHQFHYDRIEITTSPKAGFHVHCHTILGALEPDTTPATLQPLLLTQWNKSLQSQGMWTVSPEYGVNVKEGQGVITYPLKQEQNQETFRRMNQRIQERFNKRPVTLIEQKKEKFLQGQHRIDHSTRSYTIGDLEGELMMFDLFSDYENPDYTKTQIIRLLKDIQKSQKNHFYLKIYKNRGGESVWLDSTPTKTNRRRR
jgi:hypothetical protein